MKYEHTHESFLEHTVSLRLCFQEITNMLMFHLFMRMDWF